MNGCADIYGLSLLEFEKDIELNRRRESPYLEVLMDYSLFTFFSKAFFFAHKLCEFTVFLQYSVKMTE